MTVLLMPAGEPPDSASHPAAGLNDPAQAASRARVLIVEDDFLVAMLVEEAVRSADMEVIGVVGTVPEAIAVAASERPDVITMDIHLQEGGSGIDAAIAIRRQSNIPCIFVTAYTDGDVIERAAPAQPAGWVAKPFSEAMLVDALKASVRRLAS